LIIYKYSRPVSDYEYDTPCVQVHASGLFIAFVSSYGTGQVNFLLKYCVELNSFEYKIHYM